ncbi:DUF5955 family protein [Streptomyces sp. I05A-00742]|uniref:DUF5955 family protein n=1 Tax=Streptomyces sp. I05A-00742 TaxID=2732853 RepID=UPI002017F5B2|nr:DUF5955 family protein [Streptomyces sp. I05A-00742]
MAEGAVVVEQELTGRPGERDPRVDELSAAVARLRRALAAHPARLPDRDAAEDELAALDAMARAGGPEISRLRSSLLLVAGAVGSVSALAPALGEVREAVERFAGRLAGEQGEFGEHGDFGEHAAAHPARPERRG